MLTLTGQYKVSRNLKFLNNYKKKNFQINQVIKFVYKVISRKTNIAPSSFLFYIFKLDNIFIIHYDYSLYTSDRTGSYYEHGVSKVRKFPFHIKTLTDNNVKKVANSLSLSEFCIVSLKVTI